MGACPEVGETGNRIVSAPGARKELSDTFKVKQILGSPNKHLLSLPQELKSATFFFLYLYSLCEICICTPFVKFGGIYLNRILWITPIGSR